MIYTRLQKITLVSLSAFSLCVSAAEDKELDTLWIHGSIENIETLSGSAHSVDADSLEKLNTSDIHEVVSQVPGVYVREEDGYGLRPNIGIRGAASERSQNITLMEDGILIKPAPYAAPAAYYFPNVARMQSIDVFKGPSAVKYGPRTVGGAMNMITRPAIGERNGFIEASYGTDNYRKLHAVYGDKLSDNVNYLIDALYLGSDGFKELDNGGDTGFNRNDVNLRLSWSPEVSGNTQHRFDLKLGFADEDSNETYLGLSEADFAADPTRRYIGSQLDKFTSEHRQIHLFHLAQFENGLDLSTKAYINTFERSWNKFAGFAGPNATLDLGQDTDVLRILNTPGANSRRRELLNLLRGDINSASTGTGTSQLPPNTGLDITNNDREYQSQGIEISARQKIQQGGITHNLETGIRLHYDYVERNQTAKGYAVDNGTLVDNDFRLIKDLNKDESTALALYLMDSMQLTKELRLDLGLRAVDISSEHHDFLNPASNASNDESTVLAGAGIFYQLTPQYGLLAGLHRGYSPAGPGAAGNTADPEESINLEYGVRYASPELSWEAIGFFSDYSNLIGRCRASDPSCGSSSSFNGGSVHVSGLELRGSYEKQLNDSYSLPINFSYTLTQSEFQEGFSSSFNQWGIVSKGDELPYTPEHTARLDVGLSAYSWDSNIAIKYRSEMLETAGTGVALQGVKAEALTTIDWAGNYYVDDQLSFQLKVENIADEIKVVSRRPLGARPNKPRSFVASAKYRF